MLCGKELTLNPFPHNKILEALADDKLNITKMIISVFDRVENIVGKGEIACTSNFSFLPAMFSKGFFCRVVKRCHCVGMGETHSPPFFFLQKKKKKKKQRHVKIER